MVLSENDLTHCVRAPVVSEAKRLRCAAIAKSQM